MLLTFTHAVSRPGWGLKSGPGTMAKRGVGNCRPVYGEEGTTKMVVERRGKRERERRARPVEGREPVLSTCSRQTGTCPAKWWTWRPLPNHPGSTSLLPNPFGSLFKYLILYRSPYLSRGRAGFTRRCVHQRTHARTHARLSV